MTVPRARSEHASDCFAGSGEPRTVFGTAFGHPRRKAVGESCPVVQRASLLVPYLMARSPLSHLDADAISEQAKKETRNREVHLPPISVFRWWARRTEAVNGAIVEAVAAEREGTLLVADPFAGGGTIPLAAALRGHRVYAQDLNPWAAEGLVAMFSLPRVAELEAGRDRLRVRVKDLLEKAYATQFADGEPAWVAHTFRVASACCSGCGERMRLFPYAMISLKERRERGGTECFLSCPRGHLFEGHTDAAADCPSCGQSTNPEARYTGRRKIDCPSCGKVSRLSTLSERGTWQWDAVLVERTSGARRELAVPTPREKRQADAPEWKSTRGLGAIPDGQETRVLLRHGFEQWNDLYPRRQQHVLTRLLEAVKDEKDDRVRAALRMALLGTVEMAGHISRWDRWYLKSYEGMASHRFNFTTLTVEPNVWGAQAAGRGTFLRRVDQLVRAANFLEERMGSVLEVEGPLSSDERRRKMRRELDVRVVRGSSERMLLTVGSADLVLTDPPYHDDVQYDELSLPFRAWAGLPTAHLVAEAVVNSATGKGNGNGRTAYRNLLSRIFSESRRVLADDGHLIFSYANRDPGAWIDLFWALQEAGFHASGFVIVHSENEMDLAKRGVRACALDLLMDLTPSPPSNAAHRPSESGREAEEVYLQAIGDFFLRVGRLDEGWENEMGVALADLSFLTQAK